MSGDTSVAQPPAADAAAQMPAQTAGQRQKDPLNLPAAEGSECKDVGPPASSSQPSVRGAGTAQTAAQRESGPSAAATSPGALEKPRARPVFKMKRTGHSGPLPVPLSLSGNPANAARSGRHDPVPPSISPGPSPVSHSSTLPSGTAASHFQVADTKASSPLAEGQKTTAPASTTDAPPSAHPQAAAAVKEDRSHKSVVSGNRASSVKCICRHRETNRNPLTAVELEYQSPPPLEPSNGSSAASSSSDSLGNDLDNELLHVSSLQSSLVAAVQASKISMPPKIQQIIKSALDDRPYRTWRSTPRAAPSGPFAPAVRGFANPHM